MYSSCKNHFISGVQGAAANRYTPSLMKLGSDLESRHDVLSLNGLCSFVYFDDSSLQTGPVGSDRFTRTLKAWRARDRAE